MTTAATNHVFDDYLNASTSQSLQNRAIAEVNDGNWFLGRAIGVVAKPLPTIWAIAKHILFSVGNFLGAPVLNPIVFIANQFKDSPWEYPCLLSNGCQHFSLVLYFTVDLFASPILNIITPNCYKSTTSAAPVQDPAIAELTQQLAEKNAELSIATGSLEALQLAKDIVYGELTAAKNDLEALQQAKASGEQGLNAQIATVTAEVQRLEAVIANPANVDDQITQLTAQVHGLEGQITDLKKEKAQLEQAQTDNTQAIQTLESGLRQDLDKVNGEKAAVELQVAELSGKLTAKEKEFAAQNADKDVLEAQIQQLKGELTQRSDEFDALNKAVAEKEAELQDLQSKYATLETEKNGLKALCDRLTNKLKTAPQTDASSSASQEKPLDESPVRVVQGQRKKG